MTALGERDRDAIRELLAGLERDVPLLVETGPSAEPVTVIAVGRDLDLNAETLALAGEVAALDDRVRLEHVEHDAPGRWPALTIGPGLRFLGAPWGYELSSLVGAIVEAGRLEPALPRSARETLAALERDVELDVWVTPT